MYTNRCFRTIALHFLPLLLFITIHQKNFAQALPAPDYVFQSPALESGSDRAVGAVYRFSNVKTGVDALVTIMNAVNASVAILDQTGQGWNAAFQPNITVLKTTTGYVDFKIEFVNSGTTTLMSQSSVSITAMDIDGYNYSANQRLYEFEQFDMGPDPYIDYDLMGPDITVSIVGTAVRGTNTRGVEYGSINTSSNVRFTVFRPTIHTVYVRSGAINGDIFNDVTRQRSFYFARFSYPNSLLLETTGLEGFAGKRDVVEEAVLSWKLNPDHRFTRIEIETSQNGNLFEKKAGITQPVSGLSGYRLTGLSGTDQFFRLRLIEAGGRYAYSAALRLLPQEQGDEKENVKVVSQPGSGTARLRFNSETAQTGFIHIYDMQGRKTDVIPVTVLPGINEWPLPSGRRHTIQLVELVTGTRRYIKRYVD